ncbi:division/cell wall cluster transcriptional repressor MraZ [Lutibacter sp. TH_r2]|uniref:division/cell wall cluster transcriptional repressor MraZ n=1 Tax=Lutibacter sp. TH_r2 TaxID=3082083 RepID=UPI002952BB36|nr:division/cell wall cluster transcriptional repressor MraZ [Lutibacter sp. TH_r2]MDV7187011.1 division/cell wall cluster transcriptional repressor MraZ [Lutibacter sp. TH_r2]
MINLIGTYECKADAKGRVSLSVAFKKQLAAVLQDGFVIKRSIFESCLELFPMKEWNELSRDVNNLNRFSRDNNAFIRKFNASVKMVELDASGRFLLPKDLMAYAGLDKEVVLSSAGNMIEIWDKEKYEKSLEEDVNDPFADLAERVMSNKKTDGDVS